MVSVGSEVATCCDKTMINLCQANGLNKIVPFVENLRQ